MKIIKIYLALFFISGFFFIGCDKPAVTELVQEENEDKSDIEVLTDPLLNTAFDSTGIVGNLTEYTNLIIVTGIKKSLIGTTLDENSTAQAIFFDRSRPVKDPSGKLIGFSTGAAGTVSFDNNPAGIVPFKVRFRTDDGYRDTVLGNQFLLYRNRFTFKYNSRINFNFSPGQGQNNVNFDIATPPEINVSVKREGKLIEKTLRILLKWNRDPNAAARLEIIIGGYLSKVRSLIHIPLYKLKVYDDGSFAVPSDLINQIPADSFDALTFTLIRKYEKLNPGQRSFISIAQSIHSTGILKP